MTQSSDFCSLKGDKLFSRTTGALFVVLEGPDGSGKTTQANLLKTYFENLGRKVLVTKEPTFNLETGKRIRRILNGEEAMLDPQSFQKLYIEDRRQHLELEIIPALKNGEVVICDRYFFSTFAYGMLDRENIDDLVHLNSDFISPDAALVIAASADTCVARLKEKYLKPDFFEELSKLNKINANYKALAGRFTNIRIVDGERAIESVNQEIIKFLENVIK